MTVTIETRRSGDRVLMTVDAAAEALSLSRRTIWRLVSSGELRAVRIGRAVRVAEAEVRRLAETGGGR